MCIYTVSIYWSGEEVTISWHSSPTTASWLMQLCSLTGPAGCLHTYFRSVHSVWKQTQSQRAWFIVKVRDESWNFLLSWTFRVEPMLSTTLRDTATSRPWNSSMKRNALWMSKIRWILSLTHTNTHILTTSAITHTLLPIKPPEKHYCDCAQTHTQVHTHHSTHLGRKPVTLAFYQPICCCYRNRPCWKRLCVCVCLLLMPV